VTKKLTIDYWPLAHSHQRARYRSNAIEGGIAVEIVIEIDRADVIVLVEIIGDVVRGPGNHEASVARIVVIECGVKIIRGRCSSFPA